MKAGLRRIGGGDEPGREVGGGHGLVEGEHGALDAFVGKALKVLVDAAGREGHHPVGAHRV